MPGDEWNFRLCTWLYPNEGPWRNANSSRGLFAFRSIVCTRLPTRLVRIRSACASQNSWHHPDGLLAQLLRLNADCRLSARQSLCSPVASSSLIPPRLAATTFPNALSNPSWLHLRLFILHSPLSRLLCKGSNLSSLFRLYTYYYGGSRTPVTRFRLGQHGSVVSVLMSTAASALVTPRSWYGR